MTRLSSPAPNRKTTSRPTLPSLASLRLPDIAVRRPALSIPPLRTSNIMNVSNVNDNDYLPPIPLDLNQPGARPRQSSVSSDTSVSSLGSVSSETSETLARVPVAQSKLRLIPPTAFFRRKPSPELCVTAVTQRASVRSPQDVRRFHPNFDPAKHRVVLWHRYEDADAMLVMPYKSLLVDENFPGRRDLGRLLQLLINRSFMVFGPTAWALRDSRRAPEAEGGDSTPTASSRATPANRSRRRSRTPFLRRCGRRRRLRRLLLLPRRWT
ncbi:hypothetical protein BN946_scf184473.g20 [Trametes cinnabarina]|uniref:Uncharacterized protein n=1 Tax=Pycnoporus cinnabarinus TaxID=5643 RepID=A0A060SSC3_PYCCI|nr:hypothetical protein BN946_scf184473.g20 [Trametes cinnabarina]